MKQRKLEQTTQDTGVPPSGKKANLSKQGSQDTGIRPCETKQTGANKNPACKSATA